LQSRQRKQQLEEEKVELQKTIAACHDGPFPAIAYHNDVYNDVCMDIRGWMDG
jgi:hypothetical protein